MSWFGVFQPGTLNAEPLNPGNSMHIYNLDQWQHYHRYVIDDGHGERNTRRVILLTLSMMIIEISAGYLFGSMALLADGWHMGTHAVALGITAFAYYYARRKSDDPNYSFGTGKFGVLGGFASAVVLAVIALLMKFEAEWKPIRIPGSRIFTSGVWGRIICLP